MIPPAGYQEIERWRLDEVVDFVRQEVAYRTWTTRAFFGLLYSLLLGGISLGVYQVYFGTPWFGDILVPVGLGIVAMVVLIGPHELLHGLAYKWLGAPQVKYGASLRRLVFHASAPGFPLGVRGLSLVALTPFAVISISLIISMVFVPSWYGWLLFGSLLAHTQGCVGDFAILSFFVRQPAPLVWLAADDPDNGDFVLYRQMEE